MNNITMEHIAKIADVSKSTVSRALNNDPRVNEETRVKIRDIARNLEYKPHKVAQALAKKSTNIIGVILPFAPRSVADPFFLEFLQGIGEVAADQGYSLTLPNLGRNPDDGLKSIIRNNNVDGVILTEPFIHDSRIEHLKERNIPFVFLGNPMSDQDVCWVDTDNETGAYQAVSYLIEAGHRKIATITGNPEMIAGKYRLEGYKRALRDNFISQDTSLVEFADFTRDGATKAIKELLKKNVSFSAIFAANDVMALAAIKVLKEEGISIPGQIAVMGYDGIQMGDYIDPTLSTIKLPSIKMGRVAMNLLLKLIKKETMNENHILLPPRLLLRSSA